MVIESKARRRSYVDDQKRRLQRQAQLVALDRMMGKPIRERTVVYLDTREALQSIALLDRGYSPQNLLAVNYLPIELAMLTKKLDSLHLPRVHTRAKHFSDVVWGLGSVDVLDFDGTSHCGGEVGDVLLTNAVLATTPHVLCFTILCGRETKRGKEMISAMGGWDNDAPQPFHTSAGVRVANRRHWSRVLATLINACSYTSAPDRGVCLFHVSRFYWGVYMSTARQPMGWLMARLIPHQRDVRLKRVDRKLAKYGFIPACALGADFIGDSAGCPAWSQEQARWMGFDLDKIRRSFPIAPRHRGWPKPRRQAT